MPHARTQSLLRGGVLAQVALSLLLLLLFLLLPSCGGDESEPSDGAAFFPSGYRTAYVQVRDCRLSIEHDLAQVIVYADPSSSARYLNEQYPFAAGSVIIKAEFADTQCRDLTGFTAMRKAASGSATSTHGWEWQRLDQDLQPVSANPEQCSTCHASCSAHDFTCEQP